jgi:hypothetical protein
MEEKRVSTLCPACDKPLNIPWSANLLICGCGHRFSVKNGKVISKKSVTKSNKQNNNSTNNRKNINQINADNNIRTVTFQCLCCGFCFEIPYDSVLTSCRRCGYEFSVAQGKVFESYKQYQKRLAIIEDREKSKIRRIESNQRWEEHLRAEEERKRIDNEYLEKMRQIDPSGDKLLQAEAKIRKEELTKIGQGVLGFLIKLFGMVLIYAILRILGPGFGALSLVSFIVCIICLIGGYIDGAIFCIICSIICLVITVFLYGLRGILIQIDDQL